MLANRSIFHPGVYATSATHGDTVWFIQCRTMKLLFKNCMFDTCSESITPSACLHAFSMTPFQQQRSFSCLFYQTFCIFKGSFSRLETLDNSAVVEEICCLQRCPWPKRSAQRTTPSVIQLVPFGRTLPTWHSGPTYFLKV